MQRPWNEPWLVAIHEASHAVYDLVRGATIIELRSDGRTGWCHAHRPTSAGGCLAGYIAEWAIDRPGELPTADDFRDGMHLDDIRLAAERLGSDDPDRLLECWIEAKRVIDAHWPGIERVALALHARGRLSGAECVTLWRGQSRAA